MLSAQDVKMLSSLGSDVGRSKYKYKRDNSWVFRRFGYSPRENPNKMIVVMHAYATGSDPVGQGFMKGYAPTLAEYIQILYSTVQTRGRLPKTLLVDFEAHVAALGEALRSAGCRRTGAVLSAAIQRGTVYQYERLRPVKFQTAP